MGCITYNRFVLHIVKGHHLQLRVCPAFLCNFKWPNFKVSSYHPVIQKEVDKLLEKGAIEPSTGSAGFYLNVVPSTLVVYKPYSIFSNLSTICTYLLIRYLLSDMHGNLFNRVIMLLLLISNSRILIYIFLLLNITITWQHKPFSAEGIWTNHSP